MSNLIQLFNLTAMQHLVLIPRTHFVLFVAEISHPKDVSDDRFTETNEARSKLIQRVREAL